MTYRLVNPYNHANNFKSNKKNPIESASHIWDQLSSNTKKYVEQSYFTIQDNNDNLYHFSVNETLNGGSVNYEITELNDHKNDTAFLNVIKKLDKEISGGKKIKKSIKKSHKKITHNSTLHSTLHSLSSSSSSSSSSSTTSSSSSTNSDLNIFKFKPKEKIYYSSLKPTHEKYYYLEYYNIYSQKLIVPYFFSKYTVSVKPLIVIDY